MSGQKAYESPGESGKGLTFSPFVALFWFLQIKEEKTIAVDSVFLALTSDSFYSNAK